MLRNAPDLESVLDLIRSYQRLGLPCFETSLLREGDDCFWCYGSSAFPPRHCRHQAVGELLSLEGWQPAAAYFQHEAPRDIAPLREMFSPQLTFNHYFNGLRFPADLLTRRVGDADLKLFAVLKHQVQSILAQVEKGHQLPDRVSLLLSSNLNASRLTAGSTPLAYRRQHRR